jgi:DTW domain-containing protein YfiP
MHKAELELTTNTAYFADKILKKSDLSIRGLKDCPLDLELKIDLEKFSPLYLFPDDDAVELSEEYLSKLDLPPLIIAPDGSWKQVKKFKKRESFLSNIQSVKLPNTSPSNYRLRTNPFPEAVCTFEAIARAIGICDGQALQKEMESIFEVITDRMFYSRKGLVKIEDIEKFKKS